MKLGTIQHKWIIALEKEIFVYQPYFLGKKVNDEIHASALGVGLLVLCHHRKEKQPFVQDRLMSDSKKSLGLHFKFLGLRTPQGDLSKPIRRGGIDYYNIRDLSSVVDNKQMAKLMRKSPEKFFAEPK